MRDQLNAGATSETTLTWKAIQTTLAPIHSNEANMKDWLWRPNDIRRPCGPKASWHSSFRWGKSPEKTSPRKLVPIEPGPAVWQAHMLPPAARRWINNNILVVITSFVLENTGHYLSTKLYGRVKVSPLQTTKAHGGCGCKGLGRDRVASPVLGRLYPGKSPVLILTGGRENPRVGLNTKKWRKTPSPPGIEPS